MGGRSFEITLKGGPLDGKTRYVGAISFLIAPVGISLRFKSVYDYEYYYSKTNNPSIWRYKEAAR